MSENSEWDDPVARQFEALLLSNLYTIFGTAFKHLVACGYSEDVIFRAIAREGLYHGGKDPVSNIVNETLAYLMKGKDFDDRDSVFEDLRQLVEFTMLEMVNVLKEVKPSLCTTEAMWWLLMCDMILSEACAEEGYLLEETSSKEAGCSSDSASFQSSFQAQSADPSLLTCNESNCDTKIHPPETLKFGSFPSPLASQNPPASEAQIPEKGTRASASTDFEKSLAATAEYLPNASKRYACEEKPKADGKLHPKRGYITRNKSSSHLDWCYKQYGKSVSKPGKMCSTGAVVVEKRMKHPSEPFIPQTKSPPSKARRKAKGSLAFQSPQVPQHAASSVSGAADLSKVSKEFKPSVDAANCAIDYLLDEKSSSSPELRASVFAEIYAAIPYDKSLGKPVPQTEKDELILKLVSHAQQLQDELESWTNWGNQKVMQAAQRLSRDKAELKALRQEKQEAEGYKKEKKILEENAAKRLLEMESALNNAICQGEQAESTLRKLHAENSVLKKEMKATNTRASKAAASCQEAVKREQQAHKDAQSWEGQKCLLQEELLAQKLKVAELQQEVSKKKNLLSKVEAKWKQEQMLKDNLLAQAASARNELEELEAMKKTEEARIKEETESALKKYLEDIKKLDCEISELRLKSDASKIAALRRGIDGNFGIAHGEINPVMKGSQKFIMSEKATDFTDNSGTGGLRRERECVMCLSEEMSVVFLPCAHQVLCPNCNELHEKQGMKDCPSCRTPIQRRIVACFANL